MDFVNRMTGRNFEAISPSTLLKFTDLDPRVQKHLQKVYTTLTCALAVMAVGAFCDVSFHIGGMLTNLVAMGCLFALVATQPTPTNLSKRYGYLGTFAFCQGAGLGSLISLALMINPTIVFTALFATSLVFGCFSMAALLTPRRSYLFLGGYLSSAILGFLGLRMMGWMFGASALAFNVEIYLGLLVFSGYVLFDTQLIVERASAGDFDSVKHALDLFVDFVAILVRVLIILMKNQERRDAAERRDRKRRA